VNFKLRGLESSSDLLAGSALGSVHSKKLADHVTGLSGGGSAHSAKGDVLPIDFTGVKMVSASYLKSLLQPFFGPEKGDHDLPENWSPVLLGLESPDVKIDLNSYFKGLGLYVVEAGMSKTGLYVINHMGIIEKNVKESLEKLRELGPSTAAGLFEKFPQNCSNQTTWNNRLIILLRLRLAARYREGRNWIYKAHL